MSDQEIFAVLKSSSFFDNLPDDQIEQLAQAARTVEYRGQEELFQEHEPAKEVFLITSGKVALVICVTGKGCRQIMEVKEGELIGWSPILGQPRLTDTALALTPVKAIAFDGAKVAALCEDNPQFGYEFMKRTAIVLSDRLRAVRWQLVDVHGAHLPEVVLESD